MAAEPLARTLTAAEAAAKATEPAVVGVLNGVAYVIVRKDEHDFNREIVRLAREEQSASAAWEAHKRTGYGPTGSFDWHLEYRRLFYRWDDAQAALHAAVAARPAGEEKAGGD